MECLGPITNVWLIQKPSSATQDTSDEGRNCKHSKADLDKITHRKKIVYVDTIKLQDVQRQVQKITATTTLPQLRTITQNVATSRSSASYGNVVPIKTDSFISHDKDNAQTVGSHKGCLRRRRNRIILGIFVTTAFAILALLDRRRATPRSLMTHLGGLLFRLIARLAQIFVLPAYFLLKPLLNFCRRSDNCNSSTGITGRPLRQPVHQHLSLPVRRIANNAQLLEELI